MAIANRDVWERGWFRMAWEKNDFHLQDQVMDSCSKLTLKCFASVFEHKIVANLRCFHPWRAQNLNLLHVRYIFVLLRKTKPAALGSRILMCFSGPKNQFKVSPCFSSHACHIKPQCSLHHSRAVLSSKININISRISTKIKNISRH